MRVCSIAGGHLIVTGGQNWQATAAGLADLLPLTPNGSKQVDDLQGLTTWLHVGADLGAQTVTRSAKSNRLLATRRTTEDTQPRPHVIPTGCDAAFSPLSRGAAANYASRCMS